MPIKITLDQFRNQWVPDTAGRISPIPSRIAYRLENFITAAGDYAKTSFQGSFDKGGFCGKSTWAPRKSRWGRKFGHPVLFDSGRLKLGIEGGRETIKRGSYDWPRNGIGRYGPTRGFRREYKYVIRTTEEASYERGKRGTAKRSRYNYAAVHNTASRITPFRVNQYSNEKPVQRQFIGHEKDVLNHIHGLLHEMVFKDLLNKI